MMPNLPNLPIPAELTPDTFCLCLQIPNDPTWKQAFVNLLSIPTYWFNWERDEARSGKQLAAYWTILFDQIDWSVMSCCCNQPPIIFQFTADGTLQMSEDGGVTWVDAPGYDPRLNSPRFPPMSGSDGDDKKCLAATGAVALIKAQVGDELTDDMSQYTLAELFKDWEHTVINDGGNILDAFLRIAANQVFALGVAALRAALTSGVYDTLKCILYCHLADDASINSAALAAIESDVSSQITGIAGLFINHLLDLLGTIGLTNLARAGGATTGDCSACDCGDCPVFPFAAGGTLVSRDGCTIVIDSAFDGVHQAVYLWFGEHPEVPPVYDPTLCGKVISVISSGSAIVDTGYNDCGTGTLHYPAAITSSTVGSQFIWDSGAPFTLTITVDGP